jgi:hypothetical protein
MEALLYTARFVIKLSVIFMAPVVSLRPFLIRTLYIPAGIRC